MAFFRQLLALLWKNWLIRVYNPITTVFEVFLPLGLCILIAYLCRNIALPDMKNYGPPDRPPPDHPGGPGDPEGPPLYYGTGDKDRKSSVQMIVSFDNTSGLNLDKPPTILYYTPSNAFTDDLVHIFMDFIHIKTSEVMPFSDMKNRIAEKSQKNLTTIGIVFDHYLNEGSELFDYKLVTNSLKVGILKRTNEIEETTSDYQRNETAVYPTYICKLQTYINEAFMRKVIKDRNSKTTNVKHIKAFRFATSRRSGNPPEPTSALNRGLLLAVAFVISYIVFCPLIVKRITDEKANKAKELLRMMGMSDWVFWSSHFINFLIVIIIHGIVFSFLFTVGIQTMGLGDGKPIFNRINPFLFFTIFMVYGIQTILFCMTITTVFNRPVFGVLVMSLVFIGIFALGLMFAYPISGMGLKENHFLRLICCLNPTIALMWVLALMGQLHFEGIDITIEGLFTKTSIFGHIIMAEVIGVQMISWFLYAFLIYYLDSVWPFQYGVPKPFYFLCLPSYCCPNKKSSIIDIEKSSKNSADFESEPKDTKKSICLTQVYKEFGGGKGVHGVTFNIFNGQITALLGHNGAGKTTTMNMITGIFPPDSGHITVNGFDIVSATKNARSSLGLCPQENVLFNDLTVGQHLRLFAILKDFPSNQLTKEVNHILEVIRLKDKVNTKSSGLSGGMKRKLSLGIAMIGGSDVLILDEPTSGMDPEARRAVWDVLQDIRRKKTILLTTHYMEEADVLGDRIAIMSDGVIRCCGSPMFLKKRFGAGYQLRISKANNYNKALLESTLKRHLPESDIQSDINIEVIYSLESKDQTKPIDKNVFPVLFEELDLKRHDIGIDSYGISVTTMEDVFLKVGSIDELQKKSEKVVKTKSENKNIENIKGFQLFVQRFYALIVKRFHFGRRHWQMFLLQILVPALIFIGVFSANNYFRDNTIIDTLRLDLQSLYGKTFGFINSFKVLETFGADIYAPNAQRHGMNTTVLLDKDKDGVIKWLEETIESVGQDIYSKQYLIGGSVGTNDSDIDVEVWYNPDSTHSLPLSINLMYESLVSHFIPSLKDKIKITTTNVMSGNSESSLSLTSIYIAVFMSCLLIAPLSTPFLAASYILYPIQERDSKSKLLQLMTGLSSFTFWCCHYVYDMFSHLLAIIVLLFVIYFFDSYNIFFYSLDSFLSILLLLLLFGFNAIPIAYTGSFVFRSSTNGFVILYIVYLIFGFIAVMIYGINHIVLYAVSDDTEVPKSMFLSDSGIYFQSCRLVPIFPMNFGLTKVFLITSLKQFCDEFWKKPDALVKCRGNPSDYKHCCKGICSENKCFMEWKGLSLRPTGVGQELLVLTISGIVFYLLLLFFEDFREIMRCFRIFKPNLSLQTMANEDSDVVIERQRVHDLVKNNKCNEEAIVVNNITKSFGHFKAVNHLCFGVHKTECFGLLGVNGAGKTTTFSMLCGDVIPDDGNAFIGSVNLVFKPKQFQSQIGYCPQFDALLDRLSGEEMLYLFARLRGVPKKDIKQEVESMIITIDIQNHRKNLTINYSGGNKRKLSLGIAIIGSPSLVFLDEPTAGVDPVARRKIWQSLDNLKNSKNSSIILTSHSMEESETLCGRIAIMVKGGFKCLGSTQQLRSKFGQGFTLIIKTKRELTTKPYVQKVEQRILETLPSAVLKDKHECLLHYHLTDPSLKWSHMFRVMQSTQQELDLEDYSLSDTTLEQIFLSFAKQT